MAKEAASGTVGKALDVLDQVAAFGRPVRFSDVLAQSDYPKPTLYRLLQTLTDQGVLAYDQDRQTYAPGVRLLRLAHAAWRQSSLATVAGPHVAALSRAVGETVHLGQLDTGQVLYLDKRNAAKPVAMYSEAGSIGPAYCTGVGKAMMAFLEADQVDKVIAQQSFHAYTDHTIETPQALSLELARVRADGFAMDRQEHETGIICVAVPILAVGGRVLGGLSVTGSANLTDLEALSDHVPALQKAARDIAAEAESWSFPQDR